MYFKLLVRYLLLLTGLVSAIQVLAGTNNPAYISFQVKANRMETEMHWKNEKNQLLHRFDSLHDFLKRRKQKLLFAMNGGMYTEEREPVGLYIHQGKIIHPVNLHSAKGNFYWKPNGVFYITKDKKAGICQSESISQVKNIAWATQSGPMLLVNKKIHPEFSPSSASKYIRNGVGILPDQEVVFLISTSEVTMYEFARYFQELGCTEALYLDGFVSRIWWPEKKIRPMDMDFGVMISVSEKRNNDLHHSDEITTK